MPNMMNFADTRPDEDTRYEGTSIDPPNELVYYVHAQCGTLFPRAQLIPSHLNILYHLSLLLLHLPGLGRSSSCSTPILPVGLQTLHLVALHSLTQPSFTADERIVLWRTKVRGRAKTETMNHLPSNVSLDHPTAHLYHSVIRTNRNQQTQSPTI